MAQDILEDNIVKYGRSLLDILLQDKTTKKNIIWATDDYEKHGDMYKAYKEMTSALITGTHTKIIQPRITKAKEHQSSRTRDKAEVFTPAWVCNQQNNLIDEQWFGRANVFNAPSGEGWSRTEGKIDFSQEKGKTWKDYVDARRLEVSCGEAPYLVSRYDAVTGNLIPVSERIGLLDRKFRVVNENLEDEDAWIKWAVRAVQSTYGYEFQGDNLLLARENEIDRKYYDIAKVEIEAFCERVYNSIREYGYNLSTTPIVFVGGGASVMKLFGGISENNITYITDIRANAKGFEQLATTALRKAKKLA